MTEKELNIELQYFCSMCILHISLSLFTMAALWQYFSMPRQLDDLSIILFEINIWLAWSWFFLALIWLAIFPTNLTSGHPWPQVSCFQCLWHRPGEHISVADSRQPERKLPFVQIKQMSIKWSNTNLIPTFGWNLPIQHALSPI